MIRKGTRVLLDINRHWSEPAVVTRTYYQDSIHGGRVRMAEVKIDEIIWELPPEDGGGALAIVDREASTLEREDGRP